MKTYVIYSYIYCTLFKQPENVMYGIFRHKSKKPGVENYISKQPIS